MKVPHDQWGRREYLLGEALPGVLELSCTYVRERYANKADLERVVEFIDDDIVSAARGDLGSMSRVWHFPWVEAEHELQSSLSHALLGFYRAAFDHQRRGLELILVGALFVLEQTPEEEAKAWMDSEAGTPMFSRAARRLAEVGLYAALNDTTGWLGQLKTHYWHLSDIAHVRGSKFGLAEIQPVAARLAGLPIPGVSEPALARVLDSLIRTVEEVATILALSNPILLFGVPMEQKFGLHGPLSGFFEEWQADKLRELVPSRHKEALIAIAAADESVKGLRKHFERLPDLSAEELDRQVEEFETLWRRPPVL